MVCRGAANSDVEQPSPSHVESIRSKLYACEQLVVAAYRVLGAYSVLSGLLESAAVVEHAQRPCKCKCK